MPFTRLVLIRHGETQLNRERRFIGLRDDILTDLGAIQAQQIADALVVFPVAAVYSSPLQRAFQTAQPIAARHGLNVQPLAAFQELDFGLWDGLTHEEVVAKGEPDATLVRSWSDDTSMVPPGGESIEAMFQRVCAATAALVQGHPNQTIVLVSHTGPLKALLCAALGSSMRSFFHIFLDPATISVVDWRDTGQLVRLVNSHAHLGWERARWLEQLPL